jgi:hypothetical protein
MKLYMFRYLALNASNISKGSIFIISRLNNHIRRSEMVKKGNSSETTGERKTLRYYHLKEGKHKVNIFLHDTWGSYSERPIITYVKIPCLK